jgi:hypothetical protein
MEEEDGEISTDVAKDFPDEAAALEDGIRGVIRHIQEDAAMAAALKFVEQDWATRRARFEARAQHGRGVLVAAMEAMSWNTRQLPEATLTLKPAVTSVVILNEAALPDDCVMEVTKRQPLKTMISDRLKAGEEVPGAALETGMPSLVLRSK